MLFIHVGRCSSGEHSECVNISTYKGCTHPSDQDLNQSPNVPDTRIHVCFNQCQECPGVCTTQILRHLERKTKQHNTTPDQHAQDMYMSCACNAGIGSAGLNSSQKGPVCMW